jgi:hypothetical protein
MIIGVYVGTGVYVGINVPVGNAIGVGSPVVVSNGRKIHQISKLLHTIGVGYGVNGYTAVGV